tara:strand:- start:797 stop:1636 length:840 start_codon:yes stop_codon:yes gene_type:complete
VADKKLDDYSKNNLSLEEEKKEIQFLIKGLSNENGLLRRKYSEELGNIGESTLPELIDSLLNSQSVIQRRAAAKTLKLVGDSKAVPSLINALTNDSDPVVQCSAAGAIAIFGEPAVNHLINVLENQEHTEMQYGLASWCLAFIGANAPNAIKKAATSKNTKVQCAAISALEEQIKNSEDPEAIKLVESAINDGDENVQIEAIKLVGKLYKIDFFIPILISKLKNISPDIRSASILSLMQLNIKESLIPLKELLILEKETNIKKIVNLAIKKLETSNSLE